MVTAPEFLPAAFAARMESLLGEEAGEYFAALSSPRQRGMRVNLLKGEAGEIATALGATDPVPFTKDGFFLGEKKLGSHPYHHAGLIYLQEPSAMLPVAAISPYLKGNILDLCAAPGGKSTQILSAMDDSSFLLCNEIVMARAVTLASNLERMGAKHAAVCSMSPKELEPLALEAFDAIVVDAPCSGEGMFRKEEASLRDWNAENVTACSLRQQEILKSAAKMLKSGGVMVYSTCTLNTEENEGVVISFLKEHPNFIPIEPPPAMRAVARRGYGLPEAMRLFPHTFCGEGHFACLLQKTGEDTQRKVAYQNPFLPLKSEKKEAEELLSSLGVNKDGDLRLGRFHDTVFLISPRFAVPKGVRLVRGGVAALRVEEKRLEPLHGAALCLKKGESSRVISFDAESEEIERYLRGEQLTADADFRGYGVVAVNGYPLGLCKVSGTAVKNHYPKGLRLLK